MIIKEITGKKPKKSPHKMNNTNSRIGKNKITLILIMYLLSPLKKILN